MILTITIQIQNTTLDVNMTDALTSFTFVRSTIPNSFYNVVLTKINTYLKNIYKRFRNVNYRKIKKFDFLKLQIHDFCCFVLSISFLYIGMFVGYFS